MPTRLNLEGEKEFPIQAFFNAVSDSSFVRVVNSLTKGIGCSFNDTHCDFPSDLDPGEVLFEGVRFSLFEDVVTIPADRLWHYLRTVCEVYIADHPEDSRILEEYLARQYG